MREDMGWEGIFQRVFFLNVGGGQGSQPDQSGFENQTENRSD